MTEQKSVERSSETVRHIARMRLLPPTYLLCGIAGMGLLHVLIPGTNWITAPWRYLGAPLIIGGMSVVLASAWKFQRRQTTIKPFEESSCLMTDGLYRYSRNPIYAAMVAILAGVAVAMGSGPPWLVLPLFVWTIQRRFIQVEEGMLAARFGEEYESYRQRTRRWL